MTTHAEHYQARQARTDWRTVDLDTIETLPSADLDRLSEDASRARQGAENSDSLYTNPYGGEDRATLKRANEVLAAVRDAFRRRAADVGETGS